MSLINEALKRARQSQEQAAPPPPSNLEFRPVEPAQLARQGPSLTFIATACIAVILAVLLAWQWLHKPAANTSVAARNAAAEQPVTSSPAPAVAPAPVAATPSTSVPVPAKAPEPAPAGADSRLIAAATPAASADPGSVVQTGSSAQDKPVAAAPVAEPVPPKPAPPKLQAIVFRPIRPSAMINGRTMFVGDKFGDWRLVSISQESATLVGGGMTNVLVLPQ